jgi:filamentous hemagglutinin family protein
MVRSVQLLSVFVFAGFSSADIATCAPTNISSNGLGTAVLIPTGGVYNITGGTLAGNNLYHSFSTFNLGTGDTANFNVSSNIANILARVTGGPSTIDGTITSTLGPQGPVSAANLFLINPAGVVFTANALVNLGGSFVLSTANYVAFSDGSMFHGDVNHPIEDAGLTSAPVSAFGFIPATVPGSISFLGAQISMPSGMGGLHIIGGNITLDAATLAAPGRAISMFSAAEQGTVNFNLASPGTEYSGSTVTQYGAVSLINGASATIDSHTGGGGAMIIRGGKVVVDGSSVTSRNFGSVVGGNIQIRADSLTLKNGAYIGTDSYGVAKSGSVDIEVAKDLSVTGSQISADNEFSGAGGIVTANIQGNVALIDGGNLFANTDGGGNGGAVEVTAGSMSISGNLAGNNSGLSSVTDGQGDAGSVSLTLTGTLTMSGNGNILADTYTTGKGGDVTIEANQIAMDDQSLISANSLFSSGPGGNIKVTSSSLTINNSGVGSPAGITAQSQFSAGNAGTVNVATGALSLSNGAVISTSSIFGSGDGGSVSVFCSQGILSGRSAISSASTFTNAGEVNVNATSSLVLDGGSTLDTSAGAAGGNISLKVGQLLYLRDSSIQAYAGVASVGGPAVGGNGGNITIDPDFVVLDHSLISANDLSPIGKDGNIVNLADFFFSNDSILFATGTIETAPPDLDLAGSLLPLDSELVDAHTKLRETCAQSVNHEYSTLTVVGRGGTETGPNELSADFGLNDIARAPKNSRP